MPLTRRQFVTAAFALPSGSSPAPDSSLYTPVDRFFRQFVSPVPRVDSRWWSLSVGGRVRVPLSLAYDELLALPAVEWPCTMLCASNPPGGERIGHALWRGVPLRLLLDELDIDPAARYAHLHGLDGTSVGITRRQLESALLAYGMNGGPLPPEQGFPARLILPGYYDHLSPRWLQRIELHSEPSTNRRYPPDRRPRQIQVTAGITAPRPYQTVSGRVRFEGYAFAGARPIRHVALSIDDGPWMPVPFDPAPPHVWTRWVIDWSPPVAADYRVTVQASESNDFTPPLERVSSGVARHSIVVRVAATA